MQRIAIVFGALILVALAPGPATADHDRYAHIFVIIEENHGYEQIIGNPSAPNINKLAQEFGSATTFYAETHPSEPNYVAILGGSTFEIHDDDPYFCTPGTADPACSRAGRPDYVDHTIRAKSLVDQLAERRLTWKGYFESIPEPGAKAAFSPGSEGQPSELYVVKHNGFMNFETVQKDTELVSKIVGFGQLAKDLASGDMPAYAHIVPNQCNEMHGDGGPDVPADCRYDNDPGLIGRGDTVIGDIMKQIQASPVWSGSDNTAIVITWDEDDGPHPSRDKGNTQGCCGYDPASTANNGGGHIPTIVITNRGPRHVIDDTPYNHYSLLRTTEDALGIPDHLNKADDIAEGVRSMDKLFWK